MEVTEKTARSKQSEAFDPSKMGKLGRREKFLVNRQFQVRFVGTILLTVLITGLSFFVVKFLFIRQMEEQLIAAGIPADHMVFPLLARQSDIMDKILVFVATLDSLILATFGFVMSHRIAGPVYRMQQDMTAMLREGALKKLQFRQKDHFHEIAETFNQIVERFRSK